jgi:hypothetical protein
MDLFLLRQPKETKNPLPDGGPILREVRQLSIADKDLNRPINKLLALPEIRIPTAGWRSRLKSGFFLGDGSLARVIG